ncbi:hypothetical protein FBU30_000021 [Linnemannia zychae]|nr:hypothetical protein FBU30_000021 [Linnemannia zychae]
MRQLLSRKKDESVDEKFFPDHIAYMQFSADSQRVYTASSGGSIWIWNIAGEKFSTEKIVELPTNYVCFSSDELLISNVHDVKIWNLSKGKFQHNLKHRFNVFCSEWSHCKQWIATSCKDEVWLWRKTSYRSRTEWKFVDAIRDFQGLVESIAWKPNALEFVTGCRDGSVRVWKLEEALGVWSVKLVWGVAPSVLAVSGVKISDAIDLSPLPKPSKLLDSTYQLAYCLALLQVSGQEDILTTDELAWRDNALKNPNEKSRLEDIANQIIATLDKNTLKDEFVVVEIAQLAPLLDTNNSRLLLSSLVDTISNSAMLHLLSIEGLAKFVQGAAPGSIDLDDLVKILGCLHMKLQSVHLDSLDHQYRLQLALLHILDALVDTHVGNVDHNKLHNPLTAFLREQEEECKDPYLIFQVAYATQALLNVSDNESIWHAGFRRLWLVLRGGAGFAKMPDPKEIKDALEDLEKIYLVVKDGYNLCRDIKKHGELPTFTRKEGFKFKRAWYRAIRTAEMYVQVGKLVQFKDFVVSSSVRHQFEFQWGICQLLGCFAANPQWDLKARQEAVAFLGALRQNGIWKYQKKIEQVIFDLLTIITLNPDTNFEDMSIFHALSISSTPP